MKTICVLKSAQNIRHICFRSTGQIHNLKQKNWFYFILMVTLTHSDDY